MQWEHLQGKNQYSRREVQYQSIEKSMDWSFTRSLPEPEWLNTASYVPASVSLLVSD
jgi:hypothetical protein